MAATSCTEGPNYVRYWHWVVTYRRSDNALLRTDFLGDECRTAPPPGTAPVITPALVLQEMRRLPIRPTTVTVEPVPTTLVNFATAFAAETQTQTFTVTLLGQPVAVRVTPISYVYDFGDGTSLGPTEDHGARYPSPTVTHLYLTPGAVDASVSVTYRGEFSVGGGQWIPVPGTATVDGQPVSVSVREARAELVSH
jgi:hypothetical protein